MVVELPDVVLVVVDGTGEVVVVVGAGLVVGVERAAGDSAEQEASNKAPTRTPDKVRNMHGQRSRQGRKFREIEAFANSSSAIESRW